MDNKNQLVKNLLMISILLSFLGCSMPYKSYIVVPKIDYNINPDKLRIDGYYYCEKTRTAYCRRELVGTGSQRVEESNYERKYISVIVFYSKGQVYHSGGLLISGIDIDSDEDYLDYCYQLNSKNTFDEAKMEYEEFVKDGYLDKGADKQERGVYNINGNSIKIQVYHSGSEILQLFEYSGNIVNDSTIQISRIKHYPNDDEEVNEIYRFKQFNAKPDSSNYILKNRKKFGK